MNDDIVISTVILNWNREDLLRVTVESYLKTVDVPYQLIIVDNGSTDGSREVIEELKRKYGNKIDKVILLEKNIGGEAINIGLSEAKGKLLHLSENDIEYLPGWSTKVVRLFNVFGELGQLSLFSPVPTDNEVWEVHPIKRVLYRDGEIIYEALGNVGTTSVIRREIWDRGVRVHTLRTKYFLFPDDGRLSRDITSLGYIVAWAPYYLVRNIGHSYDEMLRRFEYYRRNYSSKGWVGYEGFLRRIEYYRRRVKPQRKSDLISDIAIQAELSNILKPIELKGGRILDAQTWSCVNAVTPEVENLELIYSLLRSFKPAKCVQLSWVKDPMTSVIARALKDNGLGVLLIPSNADILGYDGASYDLIVQATDLEELVNSDVAVDCIVFNTYFYEKAIGLYRRLASKLAKRSIVIVTGNYDDIKKVANLWRFSRRKLDCAFISSARGLLICTSKFNVQIKRYYKKYGKVRSYIRLLEQLAVRLLARLVAARKF